MAELMTILKRFAPERGKADVVVVVVDGCGGDSMAYRSLCC